MLRVLRFLLWLHVGYSIFAIGLVLVSYVSGDFILAAAFWGVVFGIRLAFRLGGLICFFAFLLGFHKADRGARWLLVVDGVCVLFLFIVWIWLFS